MQTGDGSQIANKSHSLLRTQWKGSGGMTAMALAPGGSHEARKGEDSFPQGSCLDSVSGKISTIHLSAPYPHILVTLYRDTGVPYSYFLCHLYT